MDFLDFEFIINIMINNLGKVLLCSILILSYIYYHAVTQGYFKKKGVPYKRPTFLLGNMGDKVFLRKCNRDFELDLYNYFEDLPFGGYFLGIKPVVLIRSPDLVKDITIKDFEYFVNRSESNSSKYEDVSKMLVNLQDKEWKDLRTILSQTFSSGKMRGMESLVQQCGKQMVDYVKNTIGNTDIEIKSFIARYTLEAIGSCAFGLDCASLKDPNAQFVKDAAILGNVSAFTKTLFMVILSYFPNAIKYIPMSNSRKGIMQRLIDVLEQSKKDRLEGKNIRNDFLQLLINTAQKETTEDSEKVMTDTAIRAQSLLFLIGGFETSSTLLSFVIAVLCEYPDIQDHLRKEIIKIAGNEECTYDLMNEMKYMDQVVSETLRMYPPASKFDRICTKAYKLPGTDIVIEKGDTVAISIIGMMMDPKYYPNPHIFDPERFSQEEKAKRPSHLYLPFGIGPRHCIGFRFALMSVKFGLFYLLKNFKIKPCSKTQYPLEIDVNSHLIRAKNGVWVNLEPIK